MRIFAILTIVLAAYLATAVKDARGDEDWTQEMLKDSKTRFEQQNKKALGPDERPKWMKDIQDNPYYQSTDYKIKRAMEELRWEMQYELDKLKCK